MGAVSTWGGTLGPVQWAVAARPKAGQRESGDHHAVTARSGGAVLAVIDGLGHGPDAARAARLAADTVTASSEDPPDQILARCHQALSRTRGAAMSLVMVDAPSATLSWLGVGNVEGVLWPAAGPPRARRARLLVRGGVVGLRLPVLRTDRVPLVPGDLLVLATDGVAAGFARPLPQPWLPAALATSLLEAHGGTDDDGLVLVARYDGAR